MSYESDFDELMPDTITWEDFLGQDAHGARSFAAAKTVRGRVQEDVRIVKDPTSGKEVVSRTQLFLKPVTTDGASYQPQASDRYTLGTGYLQPRTPVIAVGRVNDDQGLHHYEIFL